MKTNITKKVALGLLATGVIFSLGMTNVSAMGQGGGQGLGKYVTAEEKAKLQSLSGDERTEYMNELKEKYGVTGGQGQGGGQGKGQGKGQNKESGHNEDPAAMIADIPVGTVDETEITFLKNQYGEEKMARDLYTYAAEKYPNINTFANIAKSEQKHMDVIQVLLDRYNIDTPSDYAADNDLYTQLKAKIDLSEKDAIEAGITVEMVDIENIDDDIASTDNDDIKILLTKIGGASYNHLRGFTKALQNAGYETELEWTKYLSEEELNTKGPLTYKLAEKLEAEGISLPEQVSSATIKEQCANKGTDGSHGSHGDMSNSKGQNSKNASIMKTKKEQYKRLLNTKYKAKIDALSDEQLKAILPKIDDLESKIQTSNEYTEEKKIQYMALLEAFREIIQERVGDDMIDDLLQ